ncbi:hypothetical protein [Chamaesiphon minutus]|uniref:Uncharacterized protein n=1 Tax=Chamaesiphon minutus (strain ATCC 27169 / PCC 6605) TaxID=1173020 RepID=K9UIJ5_CHAP6|nr:hypothetical protein [Chamaesiphon minutus]AFY94630.1 hypothetical protein Cha6605_3648 [Chamaesiphon minutus PCC 6605]
MATKKTLVLHILTVGNLKIGVEQSESDYTSVGDIVGIKKAPDNATIDTFQTVRQLQLEGKVIRINCRLANKKTNSILCAVDKVSAARGSLRGKSMASSTVKSVTIPRKRSRR